MLYTKYISRNKQKKQNKTWYFTIMNAPEMVLQGKSWRNREQPPPEINSGHATSVRRNWPWSSAVDQGVRIPVTNDFGLPESRVSAQTEAGVAGPGPSTTWKPALLRMRSPLPRAVRGVAQPQALAWAQSLVPTPGGLGGDGPRHRDSALSIGGGFRDDWDLLNRLCVPDHLQTSLRGHPGIFHPRHLILRYIFAYWCRLISFWYL